MTTITTAPVDRGTPEREVPEVLLEQLHLGELQGATRTDVQRRVDAAAATRARLERLSQSDDDIRRSPALHQLASRVAREMAAGRGRRPLPGATWLAPVAAAVVLVSVIWLGNPGRTPGRGAADGVGDARIKGDAATLEIFRRTDGGSERLADGAHAHAGDVLRLGYRVAQPLYGVIASVDGRGVVTRHFPEHGETAVPLTPGDMVLLDRAFELDDAPRWEQFHLVTSAVPFAIDAVVAALAAGPRPALPSTVAHTVVSVLKEPRP